MLADELRCQLRSRGVSVKVEVVGVFGDLCWDTPSAVIRALHVQDPAAIFENDTRYVAVHRFPDGVRFFAGPAPVGVAFDSADRDVWEVGVLPDETAAAQFVEKWLDGAPSSQIAVSRAPARRTPPRRAPQAGGLASPTPGVDKQDPAAISDPALLRLNHALQALAAAPNEGLAIYPAFVSKVEELALDFDHWFTFARSRVPLTDQQRGALARLDGRLAAMSGEANADLWTEDALRVRPEWVAVREDAKAALSAFGWPLEPPPRSADSLVPG